VVREPLRPVRYSAGGFGDTIEENAGGAKATVPF
jgi:hypothetical protein